MQKGMESVAHPWTVPIAPQRQHRRTNCCNTLYPNCGHTDAATASTNTRQHLLVDGRTELDPGLVQHGVAFPAALVQLDVVHACVAVKLNVDVLVEVATGPPLAGELPLRGVDAELQRGVGGVDVGRQLLDAWDVGVMRTRRQMS